MPTIGENLRRIRKERRMGQVELGERSGVAQQTISGIENDYREPHASTLRKLAEALRVPLAAFFQEDDDDPDGLAGRTWAELDRLHDAHDAGQIDTETSL